VGCRCGDPSDSSGRLQRLLESLDLFDLFDQLGLVCQAVMSAERSLDKADRAEALGLGPQVAELHRAAAQRDNRQAARQLRASLQRLEERVGRDDWAELDRSFRTSFEEHDGPAVIDETKARVRMALYEAGKMGGAEAREVVAIVDGQLDALAARGLDALTTQLRDLIEEALRARDSVDLGRRPRSNFTPNQSLCIGLTGEKYKALYIACFTTVFCWCCIYPILAVAQAAEVAACLAS
jgi:hypothetical protein